MERIGIIGLGNMGTAIFKGLLRTQSSRNIVILHRNSPEILEKIEEAGAVKADSIEEIFQKCEVVLICVKPNVVQNVLEQIPTNHSALIISIAAGVTLPQLQKYAPPKSRIIRAMPNTPCLVNRGASAFCTGEYATSEDEKRANQIFSSCGMVVKIPESQINAVIGVSGSGPAYIYTLIEALTDGGVEMGLAREKALNLSLETIAGAVEMVKQTGKHPAELREMVASPGGTTMTALQSLEKDGFREACMNAVKSACQHAKKMEEK